jgi:CRP/FNR family cyclic AMP-dependent transcriptional regulator
MPCNVEMLAGIEFFEMLDADDRMALSGVIDYEKLEASQTLFQAGQPGESLFIVRSGEIELYIKDTTGQKIVLNVVRSGEMFGELSLLDSGPRSATAIALMETELLVLDRDDLLLLFQKKPDAALHMLAAMSGMTRKADQLLRTRVSRNANEEVQANFTLIERVADWIAWFSGSMPFLLINFLWFVTWIVLNTFILPVDPVTKERGFDPFPFGLLTMIVSLEAIFLSTFVMISQNRADGKRQVLADEQWKTVQEEDQQNQELLDLSKQILDLTRDVHAATGRGPVRGAGLSTSSEGAKS